MATEIRPIPDNPEDNEPEVVGTPEGDNEFAPDQPLAQVPDDAEQNPRGSEPDSYKQDHG